LKFGAAGAEAEVVEKTNSVKNLTTVVLVLSRIGVLSIGSVVALGGEEEEEEEEEAGKRVIRGGEIAMVVVDNFSFNCLMQTCSSCGLMMRSGSCGKLRSCKARKHKRFG
jgi:hypothetical protein